VTARTISLARLSFLTPFQSLKVDASHDDENLACPNERSCSARLRSSFCERGYEFKRGQELMTHWRLRYETLYWRLVSLHK
jgi:hypothetical protein